MPEPPPPAATAAPELRTFSRPGRFIRTIHDVADDPPVTAAERVGELPPRGDYTHVPAPSASAAPAEPAEPECATFIPLPDGYFCDPDTGALTLQPPTSSGIPRTKSQTQLAAQLRADHAALDARNAADRPAPTAPVPIVPAPEQVTMPTSYAPVRDQPADGLAVMRDCVQRLRVAAIAEKTTAAWGRYHREAKRLGEQERRMIARAPRQHAPPFHAKRKKTTAKGHRGQLTL